MSEGQKKGAPYKVQYERHILRVAKLKNPTHSLVALAFIGYANPDGTNRRPLSMETISGDLGLSVRTVQRADERFSARVLDPIMESMGITAEAVEAQYAKERREAMARYETEAFTVGEDSA